MRIAIPDLGIAHAPVGSECIGVGLGRNTQGRFPGVCVTEAGSFFKERPAPQYALCERHTPKLGIAPLGSPVDQKTYKSITAVSPMVSSQSNQPNTLCHPPPLSMPNLAMLQIIPTLCQVAAVGMHTMSPQWPPCP
jgi:hypothetical protein